MLFGCGRKPTSKCVVRGPLGRGSSAGAGHPGPGTRQGLPAGSYKAIRGCLLPGWTWRRVVEAPLGTEEGCHQYWAWVSSAKGQDTAGRCPPGPLRLDWAAETASRYRGGRGLRGSASGAVELTRPIRFRLGHVEAGSAQARWRLCAGCPGGASQTGKRGTVLQPSPEATRFTRLPGASATSQVTVPPQEPQVSAWRHVRVCGPFKRTPGCPAAPVPPAVSARCPGGTSSQLPAGLGSLVGCWVPPSSAGFCHHRGIRRDTPRPVQTGGGPSCQSPRGCCFVSLVVTLVLSWTSMAVRL